MSMMQGLTPGWFNGVDPLAVVSWEEPVSTFKQRYAAGGYLESLLKKYLLDSNTLTFTMQPDKNYTQSLAEEESLRLEREINKAGDKHRVREELVQQELKLLEIQDNARNQDLTCLPTLKVEDIPREMQTYHLEHGQIGGVPVQWRTASTNGLTYFRGRILPDFM
jgi:Zn-dependent M16 (insulinase) family peptidase